MYEQEYFDTEVKKLLDQVAEQERANWARADMTKALSLYLEGALLEVMMGWANSKDDSKEDSMHNQGVCKGLKFALEAIDNLKKGDKDD